MNRPGNIVTIYKEPIGSVQREGRAALLKRMEGGDPLLEHWLVKLFETREVCRRWIRK